MAAVVLGPGSITVSSKIGSVNGNALLWVVMIGAISMSVYTSMSVRFGCVSKITLLDAISRRYGKWFAISIGISSFLSAMSFQFGNNLGVGIGMASLTGIDQDIWPLIFSPMAIVLLFFSRNLYSVLEKLMMVMVVILIMAFVINIMFIKPDLGQIASGFVPHRFDWEDFNMIAALIGTTFVLHNAFYQSYLVQNKGWVERDLGKGLWDTALGVSMLALISILVIVTAASTLKPMGVTVNSASDMALQLELLLGKFSKYVFSIGFVAAAFSSLLVNSITGGGLLADSFNMGGKMSSRMPKIFSILILMGGMAIAVFFEGNAVYALIIAQASSLFGVPLIAIGLILVVNSKLIMGKYRNNIWQNVLALCGLAVLVVLLVFMYGKLLDGVRNLF